MLVKLTALTGTLSVAFLAILSEVKSFIAFISCAVVKLKRMNPLMIVCLKLRIQMKMFVKLRIRERKTQNEFEIDS